MIRVPDSAGSTLVEWGRQQQQQEIEERLVNDLMTISPFNPSLAHFIFSLSDIAMVETIVGRFSGSKTVRTVLTQSGEEITETQF